MDSDKIIYWISTGLLSAMLLMGVGMYLFNNEMVSAMFASLGFPVFLIYPLAAAKFLAVVAILSKKSKVLKEWAYAGLFYVFILAFGSHLMAGDGQFIGAAIGLVLWIPSYMWDKKLYK